MSTLTEAVESAVREGRLPAPITDEERAELANVERWLANGTELDLVTTWWLLSLAQRLAGPATKSTGGSR